MKIRLMEISGELFIQKTLFVANERFGKTLKEEIPMVQGLKGINERYKIF